MESVSSLKLSQMKIIAANCALKQILARLTVTIVFQVTVLCFPT